MYASVYAHGYEKQVKIVPEQRFIHRALCNFARFLVELKCVTQYTCV